jgi:hypothetical protein
MINNTDKKYEIWKETVANYIYKIIKLSPDNINIDLFKFYLTNYHPYTTAIIAILKTEEYKKGLFHHSFVIPYEHQILIIEKNIN